MNFYVLGVIAAVSFVAGGTVTNAFWKADQLNELKDQISTLQTDLTGAQERATKLETAKTKLEVRRRNAEAKYKHLLNRDARCNAKLGVVRMLNLSIDPDFNPDPLTVESAASPSTVTGGTIAERLALCETDYNEARLQLIDINEAYTEHRKQVSE